MLTCFKRASKSAGTEGKTWASQPKFWANLEWQTETRRANPGLGSVRRAFRVPAGEKVGDASMGGESVLGRLDLAAALAHHLHRLLVDTADLRREAVPLG